MITQRNRIRFKIFLHGFVSHVWVSVCVLCCKLGWTYHMITHPFHFEFLDTSLKLLSVLVVTYSRVKPSRIYFITILIWHQIWHYVIDLSFFMTCLLRICKRKNLPCASLSHNGQRNHLEGNLLVPVESWWWCCPCPWSTEGARNTANTSLNRKAF